MIISDDLRGSVSVSVCEGPQSYTLSLVLPQSNSEPTIRLQVYTLEKVLKMKKDTVTQAVFLDEAMKVR